VKYLSQYMFTFQLKYGDYLISDINLPTLADGKIVTIYCLEECIWELCLHIMLSWYSGSIAQMITISLDHGVGTSLDVIHQVVIQRKRIYHSRSK